MGLRQRRRIADLEASLAVCRARAGAAEQTAVLLRAELADRDATISRQGATIQELNETVAYLDGRIAELTGPPEPPEPSYYGRLLRRDDSSEPDERTFWGGRQEGAAPIYDHGPPPARRHLCPPGATRCESGYNSANEQMPTFMRFHEGEERLTVLEFYLPSDYPLDAPYFHTIAQWKQSGARPDGSGFGSSPVLSLRCDRGDLQLQHTDYRGGDASASPVILHRRPAVLGAVNRVELAVLFSKASGWVSLDGGPRVRCATLHPDASSSHLRRGLYREPREAGRATYVDHRLAEVWAK